MNSIFNNNIFKLHVKTMQVENEIACFLQAFDIPPFYPQFTF